MCGPAYVKIFSIKHLRRKIGGSRVSQNKLQQHISACVYISKYLTGKSIGKIIFFEKFKTDNVFPIVATVNLKLSNYNFFRLIWICYCDVKHLKRSSI